MRPSPAERKRDSTSRAGVPAGVEVQVLVLHAEAPREVPGDGGVVLRVVDPRRQAPGDAGDLLAGVRETDEQRAAVAAAGERERRAAPSRCRGARRPRRSPRGAPRGASFLVRSRASYVSSSRSSVSGARLAVEAQPGAQRQAAQALVPAALGPRLPAAIIHVTVSERGAKPPSSMTRARCEVEARKRSLSWTYHTVREAKTSLTSSRARPSCRTMAYVPSGRAAPTVAQSASSNRAPRQTPRGSIRTPATGFTTARTRPSSAYTSGALGSSVSGPRASAQRRRSAAVNGVADLSRAQTMMNPASPSPRPAPSGARIVLYARVRRGPRGARSVAGRVNRPAGGFGEKRAGAGTRIRRRPHHASVPAAPRVAG